MTNMTNRNSLSTIAQMALMAVQYMRGRKLRTVLTTLAIVFGVALIFAMNITLPSAMNAFKQSMSVAAGTADLTVVSVTGESFTPDQPMKTVASVADVEAVSGVLRRPIALPTFGSQSQVNIGKVGQIELVGIDPANARNVRAYPISEGRFLESGDTGVAVLPAGIAELAPQLRVGTTFPLITAGGLKFYTIIGLLAEKGSTATPQILITLPDAQAAFNQPGLINAIDAAIRAGADREVIAAEVQKALGSGYHLNSATSQIDAIGALEIGYAIFNLLGLLALFLGAFLIFNTFRTIVVERRRDLAMLRAIGATRRQITTMILIESLIQGLLGTVLGMMVGYLMVLALTRLVLSNYGQFIPGGIFSVTVSLNAVAGAAVLGLVTALVAGYWPARAASRISPLEGLRPTSTANVRRAARWSLVAGIVVLVLATILLIAGNRTTAGGAILFLVGMVIAAPGLVMPVARLLSPLLTLWFAREGDLARGNLVRQPGRAAITASTLMIGLATIILAGAVVISFDRFIRNLVTLNFSSDIMLIPQTPGVYGNVVGADESLTKRLQALPEAETVAGLRYASSSHNGQALEILGIDPVAYPKIAPLEFVQGQPEAAYQALATGRSAIINPLAASTLKLGVGADFVMQTAEGPQTYHVVAIAHDVLSLKFNALYISQTNMKTDFHKAEDVMLMMSLKPGADKNAVLAEVQKIAADYPQFTARLTGEYRSLIIDATTNGLQFFYALAIIILIPAALGLLNTLTINVLERTREIGIVRAVGGSRAQVRRIVTAEALLLGLFGASTGVLAGVAMSYGFTAAFRTIGWTLVYQFPAVAVLAVIVLGVLLALVSSILPARSAAKLDIIRALQYE
jgi:putative ABC transport system permease protein